MRKFTVYRSGPLRRKLLAVTLEEDLLRISGLPTMIASLEKEGVTDFASGAHFELFTQMQDQNTPIIYEALESRFSHDSCYELRKHSPKPKA